MGLSYYELQCELMVIKEHVTQSNSVSYAWDTHLVSTSAARLCRRSPASRSLLLFAQAASAAAPLLPAPSFYMETLFDNSH